MEKVLFHVAFWVIASLIFGFMFLFWANRGPDPTSPVKPEYKKGLLVWAALMIIQGIILGLGYGVASEFW